jgi:hypothetical protein
MTRNPSQGIGNAGILDPSGHDLLLHHLFSGPGEIGRNGLDGSHFGKYGKANSQIPITRRSYPIQRYFSSNRCGEGGLSQAGMARSRRKFLRAFEYRGGFT